MRGIRAKTGTEQEQPSNRLVAACPGRVPVLWSWRRRRVGKDWREERPDSPASLMTIDRCTRCRRLMTRSMAARTSQRAMFSNSSFAPCPESWAQRRGRYRSGRIHKCAASRQRRTYPTSGSAPGHKGSADDSVRTVVRAPPTKGGRRNLPDVFQGCDWFPLPAASRCRIVVP
jgi:hypothetical protein